MKLERQVEKLQGILEAEKKTKSKPPSKVHLLRLFFLDETEV